MDNSVIFIDDSDDEESPNAPSSHRQSYPSTSTSTNANHVREPYELRSRTVPASPSGPSLSAFERQRKRHEQRTHPIARRGGRREFRREAREARREAREARRGARHVSEISGRRGSHGDARIPLNRHSIRITKQLERKTKKKSKGMNRRLQRATSASLSSSDDDNPVSRLLRKHQAAIMYAKSNEADRIRRGLPPSRLRIPTEDDPQSAFREFFVKFMENQKIEKDIKDGYIVRVEDRHVIQLDDLDPELLTGEPLTEKEAYWVARKQARRAGPRSSSWPAIVPTHDQHTEYISLTDKARNMFDPDAPECSECGSKLWGTSILYPLSRPNDSNVDPNVIDPNAHLCVGCARLFSCVKDRKEKMDMIEWIINQKITSPVMSPEQDDELMRLCQNRVKQMKTRAHEHYTDLPTNFVTPEDLFEDVKYDNYNCYLIGSPMRREHGHYNSLTFDHIFPISVAMMKPNCWSIENLQPLSLCMNQVKGNEANKEAKRWLINFKKHYFSPNFKA